jgi:hypothetical protein
MHGYGMKRFLDACAESSRSKACKLGREVHDKDGICTERKKAPYAVRDREEPRFRTQSYDFGRIGVEGHDDRGKLAAAGICDKAGNQGPVP